MKETTQKNDTTTQYSQETTAQGGHTSPAQGKDQAKEVFDKASQKVEESYDKAAHKVGEAYDKIAPAAQQAYDKTAHAVNETYHQTQRYGAENPGKTFLIAMAIGVGIGFIWGSNSHHSRGGRYARPIVNAVSDVAMEFFR